MRSVPRASSGVVVIDRYENWNENKAIRPRVDLEARPTQENPRDVRPVIQRHRRPSFCRRRSKAHIRYPISDYTVTATAGCLQMSPNKYPGDFHDVVIRVGMVVLPIG